MTDTASAPSGDALLDALVNYQGAVAQLRFPLDLPGTDTARLSQADTLTQLDDYVLPRLRDLDAPLLAVVGGSTGAGKSTLVNSLIGAEVSASGVLRPTTRSPVLVHHPDDTAWFADDRILPSLARVTGESTSAGAGTRSVQLVSHAAAPRGLAILDAPDIDSVVVENRELAAELLAAADLWLFVTSAARYADAVPWDTLSSAANRSAAVAIILDRIAPEAVDPVRRHLASMLSANGLGLAPLFVVRETMPVAGQLPDTDVYPIRSWLRGLAADDAARAAVVRHTLDGAIGDLVSRAGPLAIANDDQAKAVLRLYDIVAALYDRSAATLAAATSDGSLLRGEVLSRWQDFVGTGDLFRTLEANISRWRDKVTSAVRGEAVVSSEQQVDEAIESTLESLIIDEAEKAADASFHAWKHDPAGVTLLDGLALSRVDPVFPTLVAREIREWQGAVLRLVSEQGADKRTTARRMSFGVNALGVSLMIVAFASTGGVTGAEVGIAGGTALLAQKVLEAVFGDDAVRRLARQAHADLEQRIVKLLAGEQDRYADLLADYAVAPEAGRELTGASRQVRAAAAQDRIDRTGHLAPPAQLVAADDGVDVSLLEAAPDHSPEFDGATS